MASIRRLRVFQVGSQRLPASVSNQQNKGAGASALSERDYGLSASRLLGTTLLREHAEGDVAAVVLARFEEKKR